LATHKYRQARRTKEPEPIGQNFKNAASIDSDIVLRQLLEYRKHHILLAQGACVLDFELLGIGKEVGR